jgi:hypothetical protein
MPEGIHPGTTLGLVQLAVLDLGRAVRFYTRAWASPWGAGLAGEPGSGMQWSLSNAGRRTATARPACTICPANALRFAWLALSAC